jgi:dehydrogenase/reductase SDR family protein 7B
MFFMKICWITGASSGIGEALAQELNRQGHQVILTARNEAKLKEVKASLPNPERAQILPLDLSHLDAIPEAVKKAWDCFKGIDVVILNAGLSQRSLVRETSFEVYRQVMEVNYFANVALTQALLPYFLEKNHGQFAVISSLVGKFGTPYRSGYSASKHALHGFYDSLRAEMMREEKNISVTIVCPGFVATDISFNALGGSGDKTGVYDENNAQGLSPQEFARLALKAIDQKKLEAYIGGKETIGVLIKRFFPNYFTKHIAKAKVR